MPPQMAWGGQLPGQSTTGGGDTHDGQISTPSIPSTLRGYYEWMRLQLGLSTPMSMKIPGARAGDEPAWAPEPGNYRLKNAITTACRIVNQHAHLADAGSIQQISIPVQSTDGPYILDLSSVPGLPARALNSIRRAWWNDGTTSMKLMRTTLDWLDFSENASYLQNAPGTPRRFAIEGYKLYLDQAPSGVGTFQWMGSCGVLAPEDDEDSYDQIPSDYDPCINYIALVELGKSLPGDQEMAARVQMYADDARAGLERLMTWFNGGSNEGAQYGIVFDARSMRRYYRR